MIIGTCDTCPHPEVCLSGRPFCVDTGEPIITAAEVVAAQSPTPVSPENATEGHQLGEIIGQTPQGVAVEEVELQVLWPAPDPRMPPPLLALSTSVRQLLEPEGHATTESRRINGILVNAAADAFALIQDRVSSLSPDGKISPTAVLASIAVLVATFLSTRWGRSGASPATIAHSTALFSGYMHEIAIELYAQLRPDVFEAFGKAWLAEQAARSAAAADPATATDPAAEAIAEKFRRG